MRFGSRPSLDELSNDLDVPSELPSVLRSVEVLGLEGIRQLVEARRVESALQQLPRGAHGLEGALLRLRCLSRLRRWRLAAEECQEPPLQGTPQVSKRDVGSCSLGSTAAGAAALP